MTTNKIHFENFSKRFRDKPDKEIVALLNREIRNSKYGGWTSAKGTYLAALTKALKVRNIDYSEIGNENILSLKSEIWLNSERKF